MRTEMSDRLRELMMDVLSGEATEGQRAELQKTLDAEPGLRALFEEQKATWNSLSRLEAAMPTKSTDPQLEKQVLSAVQSELGKTATPEVRTVARKTAEPAARTPSRRLTFLLEAAAVVLAAVLACSAWYAYHAPHNTVKKEEPKKDDLATPLEPKVLLALNDPEDPWKTDIRKKFQRHVSFEFVDTPLAEVIAFLNSLTKVNIILDPKAVEAGADKIGITLRVSDMELGMALGWVLRLADLDYDLHNQAVFIYRPDVALPITVAQSRPLSEAIQTTLSRKVTFEFKDTPLEEALSFIRILTHFTIIVDPKLQQSGPPEITLTVKDMPAGEAIDKILAKVNAKSAWVYDALYITKAQIEPLEAPKLDMNSIRLCAAPQFPEKIKSAFERKMTFEFVDTHVEEALAFLSSQTHTPIAVDPAIKDKSRPTINLCVTEMSASYALDWILRLGSAHAYSKDGQIVVSPNLPELKEALPKQANLEDRLAASAVLETPRLTRHALLEVIGRDAGIDLDLSALPPEVAREAVAIPGGNSPVARYLARAVLNTNPALVVERKDEKLIVRPAIAGEATSVEKQGVPAPDASPKKPAPPPQEDF